MMLEQIQQSDYRFKCKRCGYSSNWEEYLMHTKKTKHIGIILQVFDDNHVIEL